MATIQEYLGVPSSWPIRENIKHEIVLMPNAKDIRTGKKGDPKACALHNAACRVFDIPNCAIGARAAYIPQRDAKGKMYIARLKAPAETRDALRLFDKTGKMPEGGFRFVPAAATEKLSAKRKYHRKYYRDGAENPRGPAKPQKRRMKTLRAIPKSVRV